MDYRRPLRLRRRAPIMTAGVRVGLVAWPATVQRMTAVERRAITLRTRRVNFLFRDNHQAMAGCAADCDAIQRLYLHTIAARPATTTHGPPDWLVNWTGPLLADTDVDALDDTSANPSDTALVDVRQTIFCEGACCLTVRTRHGRPVARRLDFGAAMPLGPAPVTPVRSLLLRPVTLTADLLRTPEPTLVE